MVAEEQANDEENGHVDPADEPWPIGFLMFTGLVALYLVLRFVDLGIKALRAIF
ncbi:MAG: hypothetical protein IIC71_09215 [Acidobacteria bacterium]|nr:hypothetical protein [Acidobacteriota bacterium]